jgi:acyl-CoA thioesterase-1
MLAGVAGDAALNQADGIHPNEEGTRRVADLIWQSLQPLLTRALATT